MQKSSLGLERNKGYRSKELELGNTKFHFHRQIMNYHRCQSMHECTTCMCSMYLFADGMRPSTCYKRLGRSSGTVRPGAKTPWDVGHQKTPSQAHGKLWYIHTYCCKRWPPNRFGRLLTVVRLYKYKQSGHLA